MWRSSPPIPAVAAFIGYSFGGMGMGLALILGIFLYVFYCAAWYVEALVIDALAPTFGGQKNFPAALKVSAYSSTAAWLAGIFQLIPAISILAVLGLYSLYLLWLGLPRLMRAPRITGHRVHGRRCRHHDRRRDHRHDHSRHDCLAVLTAPRAIGRCVPPRGLR